MYIPLFGESGMRISLHVIFTSMPAILFGPIYGALVAGLSDLIGFQLRPTGAFLPQMTMTAALGGFIRGGLWLLLTGRSPKIMRSFVAAVSVILLSVGIYNMESLMIISASFGIFLIAFDYIFSKFLLKERFKINTMALLIAMMAAGVIVNTLNTVILRNTVLPSWQLLPFSAVWLPRVMQAVGTTMVVTYFVAILLGISESQVQFKAWLKGK